MSKKNPDWNTLSFVAIVIAAALILLSFFAPIIFTQLSSKWDFIETGQIGDTIGGIMNPFIAVGGVIMTFLAFYMQVKANKLQRDQFLKSLNKDKVDEKIDCYYKLTLLLYDLEKMVTDIPDRVMGLNTFIEAEQKNPFILNPLRRKSTSDYEIVKEVNRLDIYKGFKYFLSNNEDWVKKFHSLFPMLDYLPKAFDLVYSIIDKHLEDIFEVKNDVRKILTILEEECVKLLNKNNTTGTHLDSNALIGTLLDNYRKEIGKPSETNLAPILGIVSKFSDDVSVYFNKAPKHNYYEELNNISLLASKVAIKLNTIP